MSTSYLAARVEADRRLERYWRGEQRRGGSRARAARIRRLLSADRML